MTNAWFHATRTAWTSARATVLRTQALDLVEAAVKVDDAAAPRALMERVDVLRHDGAHVPAVLEAARARWTALGAAAATRAHPKRLRAQYL